MADRETLNAPTNVLAGVATTALASDARGRYVEQTATVDAEGTRVLDTKVYDASGALSFTIHSVCNAAGSQVTNSYDDTGDEVYDRVQSISKTTIGDGVKMKMLINTENYFPSEFRWAA